MLSRTCCLKIFEHPNVQELVDLSLLDLSDAAVRKMAGNGMQLAQAGFILLMCLLCVEDK